jgi:hypothetical protein
LVPDVLLAMDHQKQQMALARLRAVAHRLSELNPEDDTGIALGNLMAGVVYSLHRATLLRYEDKRSTPDRLECRREFKDCSRSLSNSQDLEEPWLAGFYFNSAILRLPPIEERLLRSQGKLPKSRHIRRRINAFKHEPDFQIGKPWHLVLNDAINEVERLCLALEVRYPS